MLEILQKNKLAESLLHEVQTTVSHDFQMEMLGKEKMDEIMKLQDIVYEHVENKETYHPNTLEENYDILDVGGHILGVYFKSQLIAFRIIDTPGLGNRNLGKDLDFSEEELKKVAIFDSTVVHPDFRGHGLQFKTLLKSKEILFQQGYSHGLATISPNNLYSVRNLIKAGFVIKEVKKKYGAIDDEIDGKLRYILWTDLQKEAGKQYRHTVHLVNNQIEKQKMFLNNGYEGFKIVSHEQIDNFTIAYGKE
ncbi:ribosomal protein S18 acetylase RimI-like enzyme [Anaerosolibacter carboniphilus]|uniref:Ribosomal protein S18 acetylase RimI-like enzyme n=1 Tax=Anaerosolibacter carboniphilus TaxID=1417629 RepID=A0A841KNC8_9FIRM|nr:GNAT family N-acetyltransferase [Anaerosolibacter carboniphilus]MBB6215304.1 ribosomal protein S18 acetylase RimI-like enzyme [Anaerosolibacter carboniphilus]